MSLWGPLAARYESNHPRRMLSLDGGGIRGLLTLEILRRLERLLAGATGSGDAFRLCHFFDYIGGTSTGAIIAAGLARGMSTTELMAFYKDTGPAMFDKRFLLRRWRSLYRSEPLARQLQQTFGKDTDLAPQNLKSLVLMVTQNVTTDSPWPISSNPLAKYNDPARPDCNLRVPLWKIVRASTAAPVYFPPEEVEWEPGNPDKAFVFVDGGVTPFNNPAFLMYRMATQPAYRLNWPTGEDKLLLVSVGTGAAPRLDESEADDRSFFSATSLPGNLMYTMVVNQDVNCRTVGRCTYGAVIDREQGDLIPRDAAGAPVPLAQDLSRRFLYARYNADLSREGLDALGLHDVETKNVQKLDSVDYIDDISRVGQAVAQEVSLDHLGPFVRGANTLLWEA